MGRKRGQRKKGGVGVRIEVEVVVGAFGAGAWR